jgi:hypothetical protein
MTTMYFTIKDFEYLSTVIDTLKNTLKDSIKLDFSRKIELVQENTGIGSTVVLKIPIDLENFEGISFIEIDLTNVKDW